MDSIIPSFSAIVSSSTGSVASMMTYYWPFLWIPFSVIVVVAGIGLIIRFFSWVGWKIGEMSPEGQLGHLRDEARWTVEENASINDDWALWKKSKGYK